MDGKEVRGECGTYTSLHFMDGKEARGECGIYTSLHFMDGKEPISGRSALD
jgi:hypothetical protein